VTFALTGRPWLDPKGLLEGLAVAVAVGDGAEGLAVFLASPDLVGGIAKGQDGQHVELGGNRQQRVDLLEAAEAYPVRADPFRPRGQQHRVNRPARV